MTDDCVKWLAMENVLCVFLVVLAVGVHGRATDSLLADLGPDSPWIVNNLHHVRGDNNAAHFKGVPFTLYRDQMNNQTEYRVYKDGVIGLESVIKQFGETSLYYREITDGHKVIKLVYLGRKGLVECDIQRSLHSVDAFIADFLGSKPNHVSHMRHIREPIDVNKVLSDSDVTAKNAKLHNNNDVIGEPYVTISDMDTLHHECTRLHRRTKHHMQAAGVRLDESKVTPEDHEMSEEFIPRRVKRTKRGASKARSKRSLLMPDTRWCGAGSDTEGFDDLGHQREMDRCCREHDHCPYFIGAMDTEYNLFNARFYTISHCYCDEVFRTCLKTASTSSANMVGRIYFNVLSMKCFEFETEEVCKKRSWWGGCQEYEDQVVAKIRGSLIWD